MSKLPAIASDIYWILKKSLNSDLGYSGSINDLLNLPNIWYEFSSLLANAEAAFERDTESK